MLTKVVMLIISILEYLSEKQKKEQRAEQRTEQRTEQEQKQEQKQKELTGSEKKLAYKNEKYHMSSYNLKGLHITEDAEIRRRKSFHKQETIKEESSSDDSL